MPSITRPTLLRLSAAALAIFAAACSDRPKTSDVDADLAHDLALSNQVAAQPAFKDTALAPSPSPVRTAGEPVVHRAPSRERVPEPRPRRERPAPAAEQRQAPAPEPASAPAPAAAPATAQIGAGTMVGLTTGGRVCTQTNRPGDKIVATVNTPVVGQNGAVIPAGSSVVLEVASVDAGSSPESGSIQLRVRSVDIDGVSYPASGDVVTPSGLQKTAVAGSGHPVDKTKVIGGAIAGAIIGRILGHDTKGTVIGAATGAAAGAVASRAETQYEGCLPSGTTLRMTLGEPLVLTASR